jgi:hypothetical protein
MRVYLGGPMTGLPQSNFPAFDRAASFLRATLGWDVVSPAELDDPLVRDAAMRNDVMPNGETWGDFLARDVKLLADGGIEAMVVLDGWERSKGARLETFVMAALRGKPIFQYPDMLPVSNAALMDAWAGEHVWA